MSQTFDRLDVNRSSGLERNELWAPLFPVRKRIAAKAQSDARQLLRMVDRGQNASVSKDEFLQFMSQTFDRLDVNKSGQLEPDELRQLTIPNWLQKFEGERYKQ